MTFAYLVICIAVLAWALGHTSGPARGNHLRRLQEQWRHEVEAFLASDPTSHEPCPDPWLIGMADFALNRQRTEFLARYQAEHDAWWAKRRYHR